jgi:hypothetical protein
MPMNRTFFLACATIVTLGIAGASSAPAYARSCSDLNTDRERTACYVRSAIYRAEAAVSEAKAEHDAKAKHARTNSTTRSTDVSRTEKSTTSPGDTNAGCGLTKEYVNGTVKFRDTCTGEWAEKSTP